MYYIDEERPYHLEALILNLMSPIWEIKEILDYSKSKSEIELLLTNDKIQNFHDICQRLKSYKSISVNFLTDMHSFEIEGIDILKDINLSS